MNKQALKSRLLELERDNVEMLEANYYEFIKDALSKKTDVIDGGDQSQNRSSVVIGEALDHSVHEHSEHLKTLEALSFEPSTVVEPGAVIRLNERYLVIATADGAFGFEGKEFLSISPQAPLYQCLEGKKVNDVCTFNDLSFTINEVY